MAQPNTSETPLLFTTFSNVVDGQLSSTQTTQPGLNPSTLETLPGVPHSTSEDVEKAIEAAKAAAPKWAAVPWDDRVEALESFAAAIEAHTEDFAQMLLKEQGKPVRLPTKIK